MQGISGVLGGALHGFDPAIQHVARKPPLLDDLRDRPVLSVLVRGTS